MAGISYKELIKLNPGFNHWTTAPNQPFKLLIPAEKVRQFYLNLAHFPKEKLVSWIKHIVQQGESLEAIANRYHTTVNLIKQLNQLSANTLRPNQFILIPSTKNTPTLAPRELPLVKMTPFVAPQKYTGIIKEAPTRRVIHIVQANDNYQRLEKLYKVTASQIQHWNNLADNQKLIVGQQLVIWRKVKLVKQQATS